jgi:hypothetical protein
MTAEKIIEMIDQYLMKKFSELVQSTDGIEIYKGLLEIREVLKSEVAELQRMRQKQNSVYAQLTRMRERPIIANKLQSAHHQLKERLKLVDLLPHRRNY